MLEGGIIGLLDEIKCSMRCGKSLIEEKVAHKKVEITNVEIEEGEDEIE